MTGKDQIGGTMANKLRNSSGATRLTDMIYLINNRTYNERDFEQSFKIFVRVFKQIKNRAIWVGRVFLEMAEYYKVGAEPAFKNNCIAGIHCVQFVSQRQG